MSWGEIENNGSRWRTVAAGAVGGLAASYVMYEFQNLLSKVEDKYLPRAHSQAQSSGGDSATVNAAQALSKGVGAGEIEEQNKPLASNAVHYGFGMAAGAIYGAVAQDLPVATTAYGAAYGAAVWLLGDEIAVPALHLSPPSTQSPPRTHLNALASHCVYGFVTDLVMRSFVKKIWPAH